MALAYTGKNNESVMHVEERPFDFALHTFYGSEDRRVTLPMVRAWQAFTTGPFTCDKVQGNHLWPLNKLAKAHWLKAIVEELPTAV